jgi:hypothetical protein
LFIKGVGDFPNFLVGMLNQINGRDKGQYICCKKKIKIKGGFFFFFLKKKTLAWKP